MSTHTRVTTLRVRGPSPRFPSCTEPPGAGSTVAPLGPDLSPSVEVGERSGPDEMTSKGYPLAGAARRDTAALVEGVNVPR